VLRGNQDVVYSDRCEPSIFLFNVFENDLALAVWAQPWQLSTVTLSAHFLGNLIGQPVRVGVQVFCVPFISSISKHQTLVTSTKIFFGFVLVDSTSDLRRLGLDVQDYIHVCTVEPDFVACETHLLADITCDLLEVYLLF